MTGTFLCGGYNNWDGKAFGWRPFLVLAVKPFERVAGGIGITFWNHSTFLEKYMFQ